MLAALRAAERAFGADVNSKGFKVPRGISVIQVRLSKPLCNAGSASGLHWPWCSRQKKVRQGAHGATGIGLNPMLAAGASVACVASARTTAAAACSHFWQPGTAFKRHAASALSNLCRVMASVTATLLASWRRRSQRATAQRCGRYMDASSLALCLTLRLHRCSGAILVVPRSMVVQSAR